MVLRQRRKSIPKDRVYLGKIVKPHGLRGEVKFKPFGCDLSVIEELERVNLESPDRELELERVRGSDDWPIIKFKAIDGRDASEELSGSLVWVPDGFLPELEDGSFYESDVLYAKVITVDGEDIGHVKEIIETGECDVLVVRDSAGKEILLPANREVIKEIRKGEDEIVVELPNFDEQLNAD